MSDQGKPHNKRGPNNNNRPKKHGQGHQGGPRGQTGPKSDRLVVPRCLTASKDVASKKCNAKDACRDPNCPYGGHPPLPYTGPETPEAIEGLGLSKNATKSLQCVDDVWWVVCEVALYGDAHKQDLNPAFASEIRSALCTHLGYTPREDALRMVLHQHRRMVAVLMHPVLWGELGSAKFPLGEDRAVHSFKLKLCPRSSSYQSIYLLTPKGGKSIEVMQDAKRAVGGDRSLIKLTHVDDLGVTRGKYSVIRVEHSDIFSVSGLDLDTLCARRTIETRGESPRTFTVVPDRTPIFFNALTAFGHKSEATAAVTAYVSELLPPWRLFGLESVVTTAFDASGQYGFVYVSHEVIRDILVDRRDPSVHAAVQRHGVVFSRTMARVSQLK
ncbi:hypothetical protein KIPB_011395, partial [Kipferlia bialata]|eukprot:g11395.t1